MNTGDAFGELIIKVSKSLTLRTDVHSLRLANKNDLWYQGVGAFQPSTFGYTGRPSNGHSGLATLYDASADYGVNARLSIGAYYSLASGKLVTQSIYPNGTDAHLGYVELLVRF